MVSRSICVCESVKVRGEEEREGREEDEEGGREIDREIDR